MSSWAQPFDLSQERATEKLGTMTALPRFWKQFSEVSSKISVPLLVNPAARRAGDDQTFLSGLQVESLRGSQVSPPGPTRRWQHRGPGQTKAQGRSWPRTRWMTVVAHSSLDAVQMPTLSNREKQKSRKAARWGLGKMQSPSSSSCTGTTPLPRDASISETCIESMSVPSMSRTMPARRRPEGEEGRARGAAAAASKAVGRPRTCMVRCRSSSCKPKVGLVCTMLRSNVLNATAKSPFTHSFCTRSRQARAKGKSSKAANCSTPSLMRFEANQLAISSTRQAACPCCDLLNSGVWPTNTQDLMPARRHSPISASSAFGEARQAEEKTTREPEARSSRRRRARRSASRGAGAPAGMELQSEVEEFSTPSTSKNRTRCARCERPAMMAVWVQGRMWPGA
mmetsp:Transcript_5079/g.18999  ORF Transcript_5079/g.18999 Transcript_5079/m.18999 type:complete len:397 (+) Transcript_5079:514-1704(+)